MSQGQMSQAQVTGYVPMGRKSRVREYMIFTLVSECQDFIELQSELMILLMKNKKNQKDIDRMKQMLLSRDDMLAYVGTIIQNVGLL